MQAYSFRAEYGNSFGYYLGQIPYCEWISTSSFEKWRLSYIPHKCVMRIKLREYIVFYSLKYYTYFLEGIEETIAISRGLRRWLEKEMAIHSSVLAWKIPWTEEPGGLQSMGWQESDTTERLNHQKVTQWKEDSIWKEKNCFLITSWHLSLLWPWENYLASMSLSFLNCKMGTIYTLY